METILGWCRDQLQGLHISSGSDMNEPKVRARTIIVRPAVTSNLSSQEHKPTPSPEISMLISAWLWETIQQQENQESREKTREPATPPPCPETRTVTCSPAAVNARNDSSALTTDHTGDRHHTRGTRLTCDTCSRRDSSHTWDTSLTYDALSTQDTTGACSIDDKRQKTRQKRAFPAAKNCFERLTA